MIPEPMKKLITEAWDAEVRRRAGSITISRFALAMIIREAVEAGAARPQEQTAAQRADHLHRIADSAADRIVARAKDEAGVAADAVAEGAEAEQPWILGEEVAVPKYGLGRVTEIIANAIGVTPYAAGYQMKFAPHNVQRGKRRSELP